MSIISNEHQSGSPFEQEPSEPGCICCRGVRCPLHGGPPQPGPEPMTTDHQPGSPHVDLDELESEGHEWDHGQLLRAELRTLRARVAALEKLFDDAGQGEHNVLALIDHYQSEAMAESEARRAALARVGELECAEADLEAQLAAAREAARFFESHMGEWCDECPGNWATDGHVEGCGTGQAYERHSAILEVEAKS